MSEMTDFEAGKLVMLVEQLSSDVVHLTATAEKLESRVYEMDKQLAKGKGFLAGAMLLSMALGGVGTSYLSRWLGA
jgi:hypothetical protein